MTVMILPLQKNGFPSFSGPALTGAGRAIKK